MSLACTDTILHNYKTLVHISCVQERISLLPPANMVVQHKISLTWQTPAGLGMVKKMGPKTGSRVKEGQRVVAVPWPTAGGEGTYQQYVAVPEKALVWLLACRVILSQATDLFVWGGSQICPEPVTYLVGHWH